MMGRGKDEMRFGKKEGDSWSVEKVVEVSFVVVLRGTASKPPLPWLRLLAPPVGGWHGTVY